MIAAATRKHSAEQERQEKTLKQSEANTKSSTPKTTTSMEVTQTSSKDFGSDPVAVFYPPFTIILLEREQKAFLLPFCRCGDWGRVRAHHGGRAWDRVSPAPHKTHSIKQNSPITKGRKGFPWLSYCNTEKIISSGRVSAVQGRAEKQKVAWCLSKTSHNYLRLQEDVCLQPTRPPGEEQQQHLAQQKQAANI